MKTYDYQQLIAASEGQLVLIAFTAEWSGASQMLTHMLKMVQKDMENILVAEIDIVSNNEIANDLGISNVPTTLIVQEKFVVDMFTGPISRKDLTRRINAIPG